MHLDPVQGKQLLNLIPIRTRAFPRRALHWRRSFFSKQSLGVNSFLMAGGEAACCGCEFDDGSL